MSNLATVSKVIERLVCDHICSNLSEGIFYGECVVHRPLRPSMVIAENPSFPILSALGSVTPLSLR